METLVIAVKREHRKQVSPTWKSRLEKLEGVRVLNGRSPYRARVEATAEGFAELERRFGTTCHIEPVIEHEPLRATASGS